MNEIVDAVNAVAIRRVVVGPLETNCWIVHALGRREAVLVDPGDDAPAVLAAAFGLTITAIVLTHTHFDHVMGVNEIRSALDVPVFAEPQEAAVWTHELDHLTRHGHFDAGTATADLLGAAPQALSPSPDDVWDGLYQPVSNNHRWRLADDLELVAVHTPGHTPGGLTLQLPGHLLTGDTLFPGGPGLTGWPLSDFPTIMTSVRALLECPSSTAIHPGHGPDTTVGRERPHVERWLQRGW